MKKLTLTLLIPLMFWSTPVWSRIFVLPGVSYDSDVGGIAVLNVFYRDQHPGRISFMGAYTTRGSQYYTLEAVRPWKGAEWEIYLSYNMEDWMRYDPVDLEYHNPLLEAMVSGVQCKLGAELELGDQVSLGGVTGFKTYRFYDFSLEEESHPGAMEQCKLAKYSWTNLDETYIGFRITRDLRDNRYHTTQGVYSRLEYHLVHLSAGENHYVFRTSADLRLAIPLWERLHRELFPRLVWAQHVSAGYIFNQVPSPAEFRIGGGQTLRGFPWKRFQGRGMGLYRNEFRLTLIDEFMDPITRLRDRIPTLPEIKPAIELAVFTDMGSTWYQRIDTDRIQSGYGAGLRVILPTDVVVRADVAWSDDGHYWGLYIDLAQSF
jgi:outer membrane protein assembly factor BamA